MGPPFISKSRLYLTADKKRVVTHGSPEADTLLVHEGGELPHEVARRYSLIAGESEAPPAPVAPEAIEQREDRTVTAKSIKRR